MNAVLSNWARRLPWISTLRAAAPIGLYLGPDRLNLVQMSGPAKPELRAMASIPFAGPREELMRDPARLRATLKKAFLAQPFRGRSVVSCLPADQVKILSISYSPGEGQTADQAVAAELRERLRDELDEMIVDYLPLRREDGDAGAHEALVALAPRAQVMTYLHMLNDAGLQIEALDIGPAALARAAKHTGARHFPDFPSMPNALLINFGAESSYLTVIWGRRTVLDRVIDFGEARLFERLGTVLDMQPEMALGILRQDGGSASAQEQYRAIVAEVLRPDLNILHQEISRTLVYMASRTRGKSVDTMFLAGPIARYPVVVDSLRQQVKVPVHILNPVLDFRARSESHDESLGTTAGMALAAGLALRGAQDE